MLIPNKLRQQLLAEMRSNCHIPKLLEDDLLAIIDNYGVMKAYNLGYTEEEIRHILFKITLVRTSLLQFEAWCFQGSCMISTEDIQGALKLAIEKALVSFIPSTTKLKKNIAASAKIKNGNTSIINYIYNWTRKYIQTMLKEFSSAVKVDPINGEAIGLKEYGKLNKEEKKKYQTIYIDFDVYDICETSSGYKIIRKYDND
ncbi:MAG: hypothetical protein NZ942_01350 [Candidatus Aenigmarchaeota archaeon]|nr:hypothetical protein [Candidatus Aenigmarchaeota archaeon]